MKRLNKWANTGRKVRPERAHTGRIFGQIRGHIQKENLKLNLK